MTKTEKPKVYGWYSRKQATETESVLVYQKADGSRRVNCTEVTSTPDAPPSKWDDLVSVGLLGPFKYQDTPVLQPTTPLHLTLDL